MIKTFMKKHPKGWMEVCVIDLETGTFKSFMAEMIKGKKLIFSEHKTDTYKMGYKQPKDWLQRAKELGYKETTNDFLDQYPLWNPIADLTDEIKKLYGIA